MKNISASLRAENVLRGKLSYTSFNSGGGSETPVILKTSVMPMLDPTPSDQKIIDHAESEEI